MTSTRRSPRRTWSSRTSTGTQHVEHAYLETEAGVAWIENDVVTLRVSTQVIEHAAEIARILGLPDSRVRVIASYMGGGFGGKEDMTVEPYLAPADLAHPPAGADGAGPGRSRSWPAPSGTRSRCATAPAPTRRPDRRDGRRHRRRRRRLPVPQRPGAVRRRGPVDRPLQGADAAGQVARGVHQQRADQRVPRLRGDAGRARLRVAARRARRRGRREPRGDPGPQLRREGRRRARPASRSPRPSR